MDPLYNNLRCHSQLEVEQEMELPVLLLAFHLIQGIEFIKMLKVFACKYYQDDKKIHNKKAKQVKKAKMNAWLESFQI